MPSLREFQAWCRANRRSAEAVFLAQAHAELMRGKVDAYIEPILADFGFTCDIVEASDPKKGQPITRTRDLYLSAANDETLGRFYQACHEAHQAHGFAADVRDQPGRCPALVAENLLRLAQAALIDLAAPIFGVSSGALYGEAREKYLALLLGACSIEIKKAGSGRALLQRFLYPPER